MGMWLSWLEQDSYIVKVGVQVPPSLQMEVNPPLRSRWEGVAE